MRLDAHGIVHLGITGNFLEPMTPRPCLCYLHETGAQCVTTALIIDVPPFNVGDRRRLAPFRVLPETHLDKPAEPSATSLPHVANTSLWSGEISIDFWSMF